MKMKLYFIIFYISVKEYRLTEVEDAFARKNKNLNKLSAITSYMKENYAQELSLKKWQEFWLLTNAIFVEDVSEAWNYT